jgi:hypothetical protein
MTWHYEANGQSNGPISETELRALLAAGTINEKTLIWREGMSAWTALGEALPPEGTPEPAASAEGAPPAGWIRCTATGKSYPPNEIVYIAGKPYSLEAKDSVVQGVVQTGAVPGDLLARTGPAWEDRATLGLWAALVQTVKAVLLNPAETFAAMKREGGLGGPLLYMVLLGSLGGIAAIVYQIIAQAGMERAMPELQKAQAAAPFGHMTTAIWIGFAVAMPFLIVLGAFITSGIFHLSLMICGGAKQPFETTFRTYCYANGSVGPLHLIPVCGAYIGAIWGIVCLCIGLSKTHEIGVGRAVLAVFLPVVVCCAGGVLIAFVFGLTTALAAHGGLPH